MNHRCCRRRFGVVAVAESLSRGAAEWWIGGAVVVVESCWFSCFRFHVWLHMASFEHMRLFHVASLLRLFELLP